MDAALKIHLMRKPIKASPREPISGWRATLIFPRYPKTNQETSRGDAENAEKK